MSRKTRITVTSLVLPMAAASFLAVLVVAAGCQGTAKDTNEPQNKQADTVIKPDPDPTPAADPAPPPEKPGEAAAEKADQGISGKRFKAKRMPSGMAEAFSGRGGQPEGGIEAEESAGDVAPDVDDDEDDKSNSIMLDE